MNVCLERFSTAIDLQASETWLRDPTGSFAYCTGFVNERTTVVYGLPAVISESGSIYSGLQAQGLNLCIGRYSVSFNIETSRGAEQDLYRTVPRVLRKVFPAFKMTGASVPLGINRWRDESLILDSRSKKMPSRSQGRKQSPRKDAAKTVRSDIF